MNKALTWVIAAVVAIVLLLVLLAVLPVRQGADDVEVPTLETFPTPVPTLLPTPSPEVLTPEKEQLVDLEAETADLVFDQTLNADLQGLDTELRGI